MNDVEEILKWFDKTRKILENNLIKTDHVLIIQDIIKVLDTLEKITNHKQQVIPGVLKNVAYLRLTSLALAGLILPEYPESDKYKKEILDEDANLRWNLGLREDFGKGYNGFN